MQRLEENRREWELKLEGMNREFLAGLEEERRKWENESGKWPSRLIWAALVLAGAEIVGNVPAVQRFLGLD